MSNSYVDIFSGNLISPAYVSYSAFALTALNSPLSVALPLAFQNSLMVVSQIADLTATTTGLAIIMPSMLDASVGFSVLYVNRSAYTITIYANDGSTVISNITTGQSIYLYLTSNLSANGTWNAIPFGSGFAAVVSVGITSSSPTELIVTGSPITNSGVINLALGADLLALTTLGSGTGILTKTGTATYATTTITGTAGQVVVTNGNGVSGAPTISLPSTITGLTSLTVGNIQLAVAGTNTITTADNNPLIIQQNLSIKPVSGVASAIRWYTADGAHYLAFQGPATAAANVTWTLPNADGLINQVLTTNGTGGLSWSNAGAGTVNSVAGTTNRITSTGGSNPVIDISAAYVGQTSLTTLGAIGTGTWQATPVVVTYGGTGAASFTAYSVICGGTTSTGLLQNVSGLGSSTQVLTSNGAGALPTWQNQIAVAAWVDQTTNAAMVAGTNYIANKSTLLTLTLPASAAEGAEFQITNKGVGLWLLQCNTGQTINFGNQTTSSTGSLAATNSGDGVKVVCITANTVFNVLYAIGNLTVA